ncbi:unnamed protein product, partial [Ceratitis capitata]
DNDPKQSSHVAKLWLIHNCPKLLQTLAYKLYKSTFNAVEQLKQGIIREWNNITPEFCVNLLQSMAQHLEA